MHETLIVNHTWYELFGPIPFLLAALLSYIYYKKVIRSPFFEVTNNQKSYFYIAVTLFYLFNGGPIGLIANEYLFSAHVMQLAATLFIVVPLIILSLPTEMYRSFLWNYRRRFIINLFTHPWLTAITFNGLLTIYFIPSVFNVLRDNLVLMVVAKVILIIHAFLVWWFIISPLPEVDRFENLAKIAYIFFTSILLLPISFFLLIILNVHYPFYDAVAGELFPVLTIIYDQQLGGGLLKITQLGTYAFALLKIMLKWGRDEDKMEGEVEDKNIRYVQGVVIRLPEKK